MCIRAVIATVVQSGGLVIHTIANSTEMHVQEHRQNTIFEYLEVMLFFMSVIGCLFSCRANLVGEYLLQLKIYTKKFNLTHLV